MYLILTHTLKRRSTRMYYNCWWINCTN